MIAPRHIAISHIAILLAGFSLAAHNAAFGAESAPKKPAAPSKASPSKSSQPDIQFLEYLGITEEHFWNISDQYRLPHIWKKDGAAWKLKTVVSNSEPKGENPSEEQTPYSGVKG